MERFEETAVSPLQIKINNKLFHGLLLFLIIILLGTVLWLHNQTTPTPKSQPVTLSPPPTINPNDIVTLLGRDDIQAIDDPQFETAVQASLKPNERIVGLVINGEARAYPIPILSVHEIVNDVVGGEPVAITWCPLCYTALVFGRHIDEYDQPFTFGVSGKLLHNTLVMYDRQTDTLWSQLYGGAVDGPLSGSSLSVFPSLHTEWAAWSEQYPDTLILSKRLTCVQFNCGNYSQNPRNSYTVNPYTLVFPNNF